MHTGPLGILAPVDDTAWDLPIDVAVVPGLGFSTLGARLGFGAGYDDRWLAEHPEITIVGVAFDYRILDQLPVARHHIAMNIIVTEQRLIEPMAI